jgi:2-oxo-3-hexenedioate decarboxylase
MTSSHETLSIDIERIAREILEVREGGRTIASIVERVPDFDLAASYRVAAEITRLRRERGETTVGRKIGFTNPNIWAQYGVHAPIWAHVYDRTLEFAEDNRAVVSLHGTIRPRLEPELAFRLARPLAAHVTDPAQILQHVEWVAASFEIVDCHFADWKFRPADAIADCSLHSRLIVGSPHHVETNEIAGLVEQLRDVRVTLSRGDEIVDRGVGANALGHPASALAHLADLLSKQPQSEPLTAGEVITTGTLTAAMPIAAGEHWRSEYDGLAVSGLGLNLVA